MSEICKEIHGIFNELKEYSFPFNEKEIPKNGIYILFEKGEKFSDFKRIVRVGTHTGNNQLQSRLKQHFVKENKDRSIFRKNIGRALLNSENDSFLKQWELDLTTRENKEKYSKQIDFVKQQSIEKKVSEYIQNNFSFTVFEVLEKEQRLRIESRIISTVSNCTNCKPSENWLGLFSPKQKIKDSGLWLVNELWKQSLSENELTELKKMI
ncbi:hypothetical protein F7647_11220 [Tenacibaculum piscium]|uniref:hypothetical protein n=1 Tax=Tenacibaculum piscium TaxID=1458515 RepID=UPI00187B976B|nr:hypothetical protein [Tenacibaculum piscium]MBE7671626.1 hypothetical protein [Tenacibaculum piscium]MBE7686616.1 hypothetical protein [Tenacibaculum piscium]MBE7691328.1 hypothetical protein [Tenacibaculum piscium]